MRCSAATAPGASKAIRAPMIDAPVAALDRVALVAEAGLQHAAGRSDTPATFSGRPGSSEHAKPGSEGTTTSWPASTSSGIRSRNSIGAARPAVDQQDRQPAGAARLAASRGALPDQVEPVPAPVREPVQRALELAPVVVGAPSARRARAGRRSRRRAPSPSPRGCSGQRVRPRRVAQVVERPRSATRISNGSRLAHDRRLRAASPRRRSRRRSMCSATVQERSRMSWRSPGITGSRAMHRPVGELDADADVADRLLLGAAVGAGDPGDPDAERRRRSASSAPSAIASATSGETAPWRSISSAATPSSSTLASFE